MISFQGGCPGVTRTILLKPDGYDGWYVNQMTNSCSKIATDFHHRSTACKIVIYLCVVGVIKEKIMPKAGPKFLEMVAARGHAKNRGATRLLVVPSPGRFVPSLVQNLEALL
jgi:hypothetical protein